MRQHKPRVSAYQIFVGIDLGTSSLKGVAVDDAGHLVASGQAHYHTLRSGPGRAEQSSAHWISALSTVIGRLAQNAKPDRWAGIGLSGMLPTLVTLDSADRPIEQAVTWEDARAQAEGDALREAVGAERLHRLTGQWVDGRYLLPMFGWIRKHDPARARATRTVCGAKDYLYLYMTGDLATDPSTAAGYGCFDLEAGAWHTGVLEAAGLHADVLPRVAVPSTSAASRIEPAKGVPVHLGAADSVLGAAGLGARFPGQVACGAGTSTVVIQVSDRIQLDPAHRYLVTPTANPGTWGLEMDLVSTGSGMQWLAELMNLDRGVPELVELAEAAPAGANGLTFLPYLGFGEQAALWNPALQGAVIGLTLGHGREDIARALIDGIAIEIGNCLRVLGESSSRPAEIRAAGAFPLLWQAVADATGTAVEWMTSGESIASALGAAMIAAQATGVNPEVLLSGLAIRRFEPDATAAEQWAELDRRHARYLAMISQDKS